MKCPYCNKEMITGSIQNGHAVIWYNTTKKSLMLMSGDEDVILSPMNFFGSGVIAHRCPDCEKIIIDYGDEYSDMNNKRKK